MQKPHSFPSLGHVSVDPINSTPVLPHINCHRRLLGDDYRVWRVPWNISKSPQEAVRIRVVRVWRIRVPWNISKSSHKIQEAVRIRVIRVWRIRVPWSISK
jgi:hypothetical protein